MKSIKKHTNLYIVGVFLYLLIGLYMAPKIFSTHYVASSFIHKGLASSSQSEKEISLPLPSYVETPRQVKGLYMTSWTASTPSLRDKLITIVDTTELNTVVIDIKDYTGKIIFPVTNKVLKDFGSEEVRVKDLKEFIEKLHIKNIYVIGRVAVFQDAYFVGHRPDLAVENKAGTSVWKDRKGISWIDPGAREYWDYILLVAKESHALGFDEINFDYIRFPSDGNMQDISYPFSSTTPKVEVMKNFFQYLHRELVEKESGLGNKDTPRLKISADLFGMVTTTRDDMGIGQLLENTLPYFDYIMPMVYPSHYPATFQGFKDSEAHPYEVVKYAMAEAVKRATVASTSPVKLRPWLQDFGLRMVYGPQEVKTQIQATYDAGLDSWILWSASNKYTVGALETE